MEKQALTGQPRPVMGLEVNTPYEFQNRSSINIFLERAPADSPPTNGEGAFLLHPKERIRERRAPSTEIFVWTQMEIDEGMVVFTEAV